MATWRPDPTFYPSPQAAMEAPREQLAYVATLNPASADGADGADGAGGNRRPDALVVADVDPQSSRYGQIVGRMDMPQAGDELHHFGWNACSAALCPYAPHPHVERRYLVIPGLRSSRIYIADTKPDPAAPRIVKTIEPAEVARAGYSRPHTVHCGPDGIYVSAIGAPGGEGPGGVFVLDHESFAVRGPWEADRGDQYFGYDFWWHLGQDTMLTSEWGTPNMVEAGVNPELLLAGKYGHSLHVWDLRTRRHLQTLDLGAEQQMVLELRPAHDPRRDYGFVNAVLSLKDLSSSIWTWYRENGTWRVRKVIEIPAEPAATEQLPPALQPFGAVPPLITDINLSLDDKYLYVSCWGTGDFRQYDVSDPFAPKLTGTVRLGGIVSHGPHPAHGALNGGPQMVELSRDGRRAYVSNSLYASWDAQFYPEGIRGWVAKLEADPAGGLTIDPGFFIPFEGERPHQVHLQGGDASSDSYCFS
jgi:selenium-binding protein 1